MKKKLAVLNSISILAVIAINGIAGSTGIFGETVGGISDKYNTLFTPAGYAFSIWGIIYLGLIAFAIFQNIRAFMNDTDSGPFTIFAPTDDAFAQLFADLGVSGIEEISAETLIPILQYHVVSGNVLSSDLSDGDVNTLNGAIRVALSESVTINESSEVIAIDIQGTNGVVHVINKVLLP